MDYLLGVEPAAAAGSAAGEASGIQHAVPPELVDPDRPGAAAARCGVEVRVLPQSSWADRSPGLDACERCAQLVR